MVLEREEVGVGFRKFESDPAATARPDSGRDCGGLLALRSGDAGGESGGTAYEKIVLKSY